MNIELFIMLIFILFSLSFSYVVSWTKNTNKTRWINIQSENETLNRLLKETLSILEHTKFKTVLKLKRKQQNFK